MSKDIEAPVATISPVVEQDTSDSAELSHAELIQTMLPSPEVVDLGKVSQFGFHYNKKVFDGWVKQPSPCCAAAAVAGAWNALSNRHRNDVKALSHTDILNVYEQLLRDMIISKKKSFERRLGASIDSLIVMIRGELKLMGRFIGGKKKLGVTKRVLIQILKIIASKYKLNGDADVLSESLDASTKNVDTREPKSSVELITELMGGSGITVTAIENNKIGTDSDDDEEESDTADDDVLEIPKLGEINKKSSTKLKPWDWTADLLTLLKNMSGIVKLRDERPSTAAIGNWGIISAVSKVSEYSSLGTTVEATLFMGKKSSKRSKIDYALSKKDSEVTIATQWDALR